MRLAVDGNIAYHWKHNAVKSFDKSRKMRSTVPSWGLESGLEGSTTRNQISSRNSLFYQMFTKIALALPVKLLYRTEVKKTDSLVKLSYTEQALSSHKWLCGMVVGDGTCEVRQRKWNLLSGGWSFWLPTTLIFFLIFATSKWLLEKPKKYFWRRLT